MEPATCGGLGIFERGWLSSNNILLHGNDGEDATLIDSSHCLHAPQTVALIRHALRTGQRLSRVVNTHLHSDHCGGNAALAREFGAEIHIPPGDAEAVARWDQDRLTYRLTGQRCERFRADALLLPGQAITVGTRTWQALAAPGHDPHSLILFDAHDGTLISADALWQNGFGVVFPELDGENGFDDVSATLDLIESLDARCVIPGHGAPFTDVASAMQRARSRLAAFRADPARHARHGIKALAMYHLLEVGSQPVPDLLAWFGATPIAQRVWLRMGRPAGSLAAWGRHLVAELTQNGTIAVRDGIAHTP